MDCSKQSSLDVYASSVHQTEFSIELRVNGLQENLGRCDIRAWKSIFQLCTDTDIDTLVWTEVSTETIKQFYQDATYTLQEISDEYVVECAQIYDPKLKDATKWDVIMMCKYLEICCKHNATLWIC